MYIRFQNIYPASIKMLLTNIYLFLFHRKPLPLSNERYIQKEPRFECPILNSNPIGYLIYQKHTVQNLDESFSFV